MSSLAVFLNGNKVGSLGQNDHGDLEFVYDRVWLNRLDAIPLSRSLPLKPEAFPAKQARPFFAGVLPEQGPRNKIAAILGISEGNDFAMLERIGGECAGAVTILPEGVSPEAPGESKLRKLTEAELTEIIAELPRRPLMAGKEGVRLSLAGAQDKLPVVIQNAKIFLPLEDTPSTHIIKPEPERFPGLVQNEFFCMKLAKAVGLNVPDVETRAVGGVPCIVVKRYDRMVGNDNSVTRIHQEDFCQALGFVPERKYQEEGGPGLKECVNLLREWSSVPVLDISRFVDGLIFNAAICNADAHAKNYSLLYSAEERSLAPFYDLVCTAAWPELSEKLAMKIGGCKTAGALNMGHWKKMAEETGLGWPMVRDRVITVARAVQLKSGELRQQIESANRTTADRIAEIVSRAVSHMLK